MLAQLGWYCFGNFGLVNFESQALTRDQGLGVRGESNFDLKSVVILNHRTAVTGEIRST